MERGWDQTNALCQTSMLQYKVLWYKCMKAAWSLDHCSWGPEKPCILSSVALEATLCEKITLMMSWGEKNDIIRVILGLRQSIFNKNRVLTPASTLNSVALQRLFRPSFLKIGDPTQHILRHISRLLTVTALESLKQESTTIEKRQRLECAVLNPYVD